MIHRNSYLNFPGCLTRRGSPPDRPDLMFAGQLTGVEGYVESAASGLLAAVTMDRVLRGLEPALPPGTTMLGALMRYLREAKPGRFQPMNSNWGLVDALPERIRDRREKRRRLSERAIEDLRAWMAAHGVEAIEARAPAATSR